MRPVTWLHISDFHLREGQELPQKAVLTAMLEDIERRCAAGLVVDFVLATGDLTFSGSESEYALVAAFFGELSSITRLSRDMIFCIPGNHDVQRDRYKALFFGARQKLQSENNVYTFLSDTEERDTLLLRQEGFTNFLERTLVSQERKRTADGLGYVSVLDIDDLRIAIIALNSAWLSEGGSTDERRLLLGEHQVVAAINMATCVAPHIIVGMQHHPFDYLRRFDQQSTQRRLEDACHVFHHGHLHQPDAMQAVTHSGKCLTLAAGASFESREFHNAYSVISLDPLHARSEVIFVQYGPSEGAFCYESRHSYTQDIDVGSSCSVIELAAGIERYCEDSSCISYYLASLLLGDVTDVPIRTDETVGFGSPDLLSKQSDRKLMETTHSTLAVGRAVRLLYGRKPLDEILKDHGEPVRAYVETLRELGAAHTGLKEQLVMRSDDAAGLAGAKDTGPFRHTLSLLDELLEQGDWDGLRELSERCSKLVNPVVAVRGKRTLALCLARYSDRSERQRAIFLYRELALSEHCEPEDWGALAALLTDDGKYEEVKGVVKHCIRRFPQKIDGFVKIGMSIVAATGDIAFREELRQFRGEERR